MYFRTIIATSILQLRNVAPSESQLEFSRSSRRMWVFDRNVNNQHSEFSPCFHIDTAGSGNCLGFPEKVKDKRYTKVLLRAYTSLTTIVWMPPNGHINGQDNSG